MDMTKIKKDLQTLEDQFQQARDNLSKIKLGWFNSKQQEEQLNKAKKITKRGELACNNLQMHINDTLQGFNADQFKELEQFIKLGKPYTISKGKVSALISIIVQIVNVIYEGVVYGIETLSWTTIINPSIFISAATASVVGVLIYEVIKAKKNTQILNQMLKLENCVKKLQLILSNAKK